MKIGVFSNNDLFLGFPIVPITKEQYDDIFNNLEKYGLVFNGKDKVRERIKNEENGSTVECPFDGVITMPSGQVSGNTCEDFKNLFFSSINPTIDIQGTPAFGLYEVGQILTTPLIEVRGHLGANPTGTLTQLDIAETGFTQSNPTANTWYGNNDSDLTITQGTTITYHGSLTDSEGRTASASGSYSGAYPYYGTSADITTLTKQTLVPNINSYFPINMVAESDTEKYKADIQEDITITGVEFYNTISGEWERMGGSKTNSLTLWNTTTETHDVQGNTVNYTRYTHNGPKGGALQMRFHQD